MSKKTFMVYMLVFTASVAIPFLMIGTEWGFDRLYDVFAFTKHILISVTIIIGYAMIRQLVCYDRTRSTGFVTRNGLRSLGIVSLQIIIACAMLVASLYTLLADWLYMGAHY
jgi:hypothetical protein